MITTAEIRAAAKPDCPDCKGTGEIDHYTSAGYWVDCTACKCTRKRRETQTRKMTRELNKIIATQNLYRDCSRYITAHARAGVVYVTNLHTGKEFPYTNDGTFRNGNGYPVLIKL